MMNTVQPHELNLRRHEAIMLFFGPLCYSPMLQTMSDYALKISSLLKLILQNKLHNVTASVESVQ